MQEVRSEMTSNVWKILVAVGERVEEDQELMILESMKMEIPVSSPVAGTVAKLHVAEGQSIDEEDLLAEITL